jgi:hypothetical protein
MTLRFLVSAFLCSSVCAQVVWNVPNGASVDVYISQASPGDILQLGANHAGFTLNKGLVVQGAVGGTTICVPFQVNSNQIVVAVPAGQSASLDRLQLITWLDGHGGVYRPSLTLQSGLCDVRDVSVAGVVTVQAGSHVLERLAVSQGVLQVIGGICTLTQSVLTGLDSRSGLFGLPTGSSAAVDQTGGILVASGVTARGGSGQVSVGFTIPAMPAVAVTGGTAYVTDSAFTGGAGPGVPASQALSGNGSVSVARTSLLSGSGSTGSGTGFTSVPEMVGMSCAAAPVRGGSFTVTATAGSSLGLLGIVAGFDATPNSLPPVVEPVFGAPAQWMVLTLALPGAGAQVGTTVSVPNVTGLLGAQVWLQAAQLAGAQVHASTLVGGPIR